MYGHPAADLRPSIIGSWDMWACANCLDDAKTAMKTSIRDKSIETSLESIKTDVINLKAAIVSTDTKTTVNGHTATLVTPDDQSKIGNRINGVPEPPTRNCMTEWIQTFKQSEKLWSIWESLSMSLSLIPFG